MVISQNIKTSFGEVCDLMDKGKGIIVTLVGHSGVGKSTLIKAMKQEFPNSIHIPSYTTRIMRAHEGETQGNPYYFISLTEFKRMIMNDEFTEHSTSHGEFYGTPKQPYWNAIIEGKIILKDINIEGCLEMMKIFGNRVLPVFITVSDIEVLSDRLIKRGESVEEINKRMKSIEQEKYGEGVIENIIVNDDIEMAINSLTELIKSKLIQINEEA